MARSPKVISLGALAIAWIEHFLVHGPGDIEGQSIEVDDEFAAFIVKCYRLNPNGSRMVRRGAISRPKGRAKSELAAFIACFEALGPCRFAGFAKGGERTEWGYVYGRGEPMGEPVKRPSISCFATELGQSGNTFDAIRYILDPERGRDENEPAPQRDRLIAYYGTIDVGLTRIILPGGGTITPETAKDTSKDGGKETFCVFDETHLWVLSTLVGLHQTVIRNLFKRKIASGWCLETTTMYAPGENSVAEGTHAYAKLIAEGRVSRLRLVFDHKQASAKWDVTKRADRVGGLHEVYGPASAWMDLESIADSYDDPQTSKAQWERYWFNRPVSIQGSFVSDVAYTECHVPALHPARFRRRARLRRLAHQRLDRHRDRADGRVPAHDGRRPVGEAARRRCVAGAHPRGRGPHPRTVPRVPRARDRGRPLVVGSLARAARRGRPARGRVPAVQRAHDAGDEPPAHDDQHPSRDP